MTLRVAIAYNFNDRDWFGGRNYFASLLRAASASMAPGEFEFVLVVGHKTETSLPAEFPALKVLKTSLMDRLSLPWLLRQLDMRLFNHDRLLAAFLRRHGVGLLTHSMPLGRSADVKTIAWLYDFQFLHLPQYWNPRHIRWARQWYSAACRHCDAVIVSSASALADLQCFAPTGDAVRHVLRFVSNPVDLAGLPSLDALRDRYGITPGYFYLPNQFWANKNHTLAIDALGLLKQRGIEVTIVCTGKTLDGRQPKYFEKLMQHCASVGVADRFRVLGIVPYRDTQGLMAHARAVINPSRFEGWSTTVEEAKTLHKDLFLSDIPVHREQTPMRGAFFAVDDAAGLAALMERAVATPTPSTSAEAILADYERRNRAFGDEYVAILRAVCAGRPGTSTG